VSYNLAIAVPVTRRSLAAALTDAKKGEGEVSGDKKKGRGAKTVL